MEFWELEEHEVGYCWLQALKIVPGNGVLGTRRPQNNSQSFPELVAGSLEVIPGRELVGKKNLDGPFADFWS
eukprot:2828107-Pyramimonas_sp.AAC.1